MIRGSCFPFRTHSAKKDSSNAARHPPSLKCARYLQRPGRLKAFSGQKSAERVFHALLFVKPQTRRRKLVLSSSICGALLSQHPSQELSCGFKTPRTQAWLLMARTSGEQGGERGTFPCLSRPDPQIPSKARAGGLTVRWRGRAPCSASEFDEALTSQSLQELSPPQPFGRQALVSWKATVPPTWGWGVVSG